MTALRQLLDLANAPDPIAVSVGAADLEELSLKAANERLDSQRPTLPALNQRCAETGVDAIKSREDLVPLLFSHSTYKSYPASIIARGQWDRLSLWLETVTTSKITSVDLTGVTDIDSWLQRLKDNGYHVVATSGTTGKNSFLLMDEADVAMADQMSLALFGFPNIIAARNDRPIVLLVPGNAPMRYCYGFRAYTREIARPGAAHSLSDEPMLVSDNIRAAALRKSMSDGSITPAELAAARADDEQRRRKTDTQIRRVTDLVLGYRAEPQIVLGPWAVWWRLMELAHEDGVRDGTFHPETVAMILGGLKGMTLPDDHEEQMARFLGNVRRPNLYSMSEYSTVSPMCEAGLE